MKVTLEDSDSHTLYLSDDSGCGSGDQQLAYTLKRLLLSHSNSEGAAIQTAAVQSLVLLLRGPLGSSFAVAVLKADIEGALMMFVCYQSKKVSKQVSEFVSQHVTDEHGRSKGIVK